VVAEEPVSNQRPRGERLLVVDDEVEVLHYLETTLERAGYRVEAYSNATAALSAYVRAGNDPFRLVLTDVLMPDINGVELARRLLSRDPGVRVLFLSAYVSSDFPQQDLASYAFEFLPKPFGNEQLLRAVRAAIDRPTRRPPGEPGARPEGRSERPEGTSRK